jgi:hypothetical protein
LTLDLIKRDTTRPVTLHKINEGDGLDDEGEVAPVVGRLGLAEHLRRSGVALGSRFWPALSMVVVVEEDAGVII